MGGLVDMRNKNKCLMLALHQGWCNIKFLIGMITKLDQIWTNCSGGLNVRFEPKSTVLQWHGTDEKRIKFAATDIWGPITGHGIREYNELSLGNAFVDPRYKIRDARSEIQDRRYRIRDAKYGCAGDASISGGHLEKLHHKVGIILQLHPGQF